MAVGNPGAVPQWTWQCGFYPAAGPATARAARAPTFEEARANFERAWAIFLSKRTEADFQAWRDQQAWSEEKHRRFDRGERMPPNWKPLAAA